jgi:hypothetical protein
VVCLNYEINKEYITLTYCENKDKPKLKCNGKCHLRKQLKAQEKQENSGKSNTKTEREIQWQSTVPGSFKNTLGEELSDLNYHYVLLNPERYPDPFFHPPGSVSQFPVLS